MTRVLIIFLLFINVLGLVIFSSAPGTADVGIRESWAQTINEYGLLSGYHAINSDYPPLGLYLIALVNKIGDMFGVSHLFMLKLLIFAFNTITSILFYRLTKSTILSIVLAIFLLPLGLGLGYIDVFFFPLIILFVENFNKNKFWLSMGMFTIAIMLKWQPIMIIPAILIYISKNIRMIKINKWNLVSIFLIIITLLPISHDLFISFFHAAGHRAISANAANIYWIYSALVQYANTGVGRVGVILINSGQVELILKSVFVVIYIVLTCLLLKLKSNRYLVVYSSYITSLAYFMFNVGVHENHLVLPVLLSLIMAGMQKSWITTSIMLTISATLNLYFFYGFTGVTVGGRMLGLIDLTVILSMFNLFITYFSLRKILNDQI